jgi:hypothetical protein
MCQTAFGQKNIRPKNYRIDIMDASFTSSNPEQGAYLRAEYKNDTIVSMEAWFGFNYGDIRRSFYFWQGELITVTEVQRLYNGKDAEVELDSIKPCFNARYLFEEGALTSIKQTGTYSFIDGPQDKKSVEAMYLSFNEQYQVALNEKRAVKKNRKRIKKKKK